jgi:hypothetical protein
MVTTSTGSNPTAKKKRLTNLEKAQFSISANFI